MAPKKTNPKKNNNKAKKAKIVKSISNKGKKSGKSASKSASKSVSKSSSKSASKSVSKSSSKSVSSRPSKNNINETEIVIGICIVCFVIFLVLVPTRCSNNLQSVRELFTDTTNILLLGILVLCVTMIDYKMGMCMALLILIISAYVNNMTLDEISDTCFTNDNEFNSNYNPEFYNQFKMPFENFENQNEEKQNEKKQEKEIQKKEIQKKEIQINESKEVEYNLEKDLQNETKVIDDKMDKQLKYKYDFLTDVQKDDCTDYDVNGCRYDNSNTLQSFTKYGPPLAWCKTYDLSKLEKYGTLFYPLNG